jgi:parallel beta-helix repeat protein
VLWGGLYDYWVARQASERLITNQWQAAAQTMQKAQPNYQRKFAYYEVKPGQTIGEVASFFGVSTDSLRDLNPTKTFVGGAIVKIPPVERPMSDVEPTDTLALANVVLEGDIIRIIQDYDRNQTIRTTIPEVRQVLASYDAIERVGTKTYRIVRPIQLDGDIRLDITSDTVESLELVSTDDVIAPLLMDGGSVLFKDVQVTSIDPATGEPDPSSGNGRAYVRMKNGRMDALNSTFSWLGNGLPPGALTRKAAAMDVEREGGTYGFSYRISSDALGSEVATGWVEGNTFDRNHFGAYTYGTSGMMWKDNLFTQNQVYGLDPHDDSNNAMVVGNRFLYNGKHGFIVSKRCNYNVIQNNTSVGNKLHGYMLHQDSAYNLIENNVAYDNKGDNFAIYESNWNTIRGNKSYLSNKAHVRLSSSSHNNYIVDNKFYGGKKGIYVYENSSATYIAGNEFNDMSRPLQTKNADNTIYARNTSKDFKYDIQPGDKVIFGPNRIRKAVDEVPSRAEIVSGDLAH